MYDQFHYKPHMAFAVSLYSYLLFSFIIGFISLSIGYYYPLYLNEVQIGLLDFVPIIGFLIVSLLSQKIPHLLFISPLCWLIAIVTPIILVKNIFVIMGAMFSLLTILELLQLVGKKSVDPITFVIAFVFLDQFIKAFNQGQYPISNVSLSGEVIVLFFGLFIVIFLRDLTKILATINKEEVHQNKNRSWPTISLYFSLFFFLFLFANNGIFSYGNMLDLNTSLMLMVQLCLIVPLLYIIVKNQFLRLQDNSLGILGGILLFISIFFYPWISIEVVFWLLGLLALVMIIQFSLDAFSYKDKNDLVLFVASFYCILIVFLFIIVQTELYSLLFVLVLLLLGAIVLSFIKKPPPVVHRIFIDPKKLFFAPVCQFFTTKKLIQQYGFVVVMTIIVSFAAFIPAFVTITKPNFPSTGIRAMAYNLHFGQDNNGFDNINEVAKEVATIGASFVSFEEVVFSGPENGYSNMYGRLKNLLDPLGYVYSYHTMGTPTFLTNAFFSVYPIVNASTIDLQPKDQFYRTALNMVLEISAGKYLRVVALHLTSVSENASNPTRVAQGQMIIDTIASLHSTIPVVILGDFNAIPTWPETKIFSSEFQDAWNMTHPTENWYTRATYGPPNQRID